MKSQGRKLEPRWRDSNLQVHLLAFKQHQMDYKDALNAARLSFFGKVIEGGKSNPRCLFSTVHRLLNPTVSKESNVDCNTMAEYFNNKIMNLRSQLLVSDPIEESLTENLEFCGTPFSNLMSSLQIVFLRWF